METDMMNKHFVDSNGNYYECTDPIETPEGHKVITAKPSAFHDWDDTGEVWVDKSPTQEELDVALSAQLRSERNDLLLEVDAYVSNPLRWAGIDAPTQALWATYRLDLLDVPQQAGFPNTHTWPNKP